MVIDCKFSLSWKFKNKEEGFDFMRKNLGVKRFKRIDGTYYGYLGKEPIHTAKGYIIHK